MNVVNLDLTVLTYYISGDGVKEVSLFQPAACMTLSEYMKIWCHIQEYRLLEYYSFNPVAYREGSSIILYEPFIIDV